MSTAPGFRSRSVVRRHYASAALGLTLALFLASPLPILARQQAPLEPQSSGAQDSAANTGASAQENSASTTSDAETTSEPEQPPKALRPCLPEDPSERSAVIDKIQRGVYRTVCSAARWIDNLFGEDRAEDEYDPVWGRLLVGAHYDEQDGINQEVHFRAEFDLPKAERRLHAFIGRSNRKDEVSDRNTEVAALPEILSLPGDDEWLVGLGYHPRRSAGDHFDVDFGVDLETPLNPYVKARYRQRRALGDKSLFSIRHTAFWEEKDGFGVTVRSDVDHLWTEDLLLRWRTIGTFSQATEGVAWRSEVTVYHQLSSRRAIALQVGAFGETDKEVILEDLLVRPIFRQRIARDWLFLDLRPGVAWRRRTREEPRRPVAFITLGVELLYGKPNSS